MISLEEFTAGLRNRRLWLIEHQAWDSLVWGETKYGSAKKNAFSGLEKEDLWIEIELFLDVWE